MKQAPFFEAAVAVVEISPSLQITNRKQVKIAQIFDRHCRTFTFQVRDKRALRFRCDTSMTYGVMFYDVRNPTGMLANRLIFFPSFAVFSEDKEFFVIVEGSKPVFPNRILLGIPFLVQTNLTAFP